MTEKNPAGWRKYRWVFHVVVLTAIGILIVLNSIRMSHLRRMQEIPVLGRVPEFDLTERGGQSLKLTDLKGKVWIADFVFTHCAGPCPIMSAQMARLQKALQDAIDVRLVSFSVDPERDTPQVLSEYAKQFGADANKWLFLTGSKPEIYELANKGFKIGATENTGPDRQPDEGPILHSTSFVLVDRNANIRGYYEGVEANGLDRLLKDARILLRNWQP